MADALAVWLYGDHVATVTELRGNRLRLQYTQEALAKFELGTALLSIGLPLTDVYYPPAATLAFLDGLLPEEEQRRTVAQDLNLRAADTFGLIGALGRDCAGAIIIQPTIEPPPSSSTTLTASPLTDDEIGERVSNLRNAPLGVTKRVRISLAGVQEKLLLTRMPDGRWGEPVDGTPSTHIIKPEIRDLANTVENEAFCMRLAKELGLRTAVVETGEFGGRKVLIVKRYDRVVNEYGDVERIHQEDMCQVMSVPPRQKYQEDGGPSLRRIAMVLRESARPDCLRRLLQAMTVNALIGNGDAHGKNFSLLHHRDGSIELAPLYDLMSTLFYKDVDLAMYIDNVHETNKVTRERLVNEAKSWGMRDEAINVAIDELVERAPEAIAKARAETKELPSEVPNLIESQLKNIRS